MQSKQATTGKASLHSLIIIAFDAVTDCFLYLARAAKVQWPWTQRERGQGAHSTPPINWRREGFEEEVVADLPAEDETAWAVVITEGPV